MSGSSARAQLDLSAVVTRVQTTAEARTLPAGTVVGDMHGGVTFTDAVALELEKRSHHGWCDVPTGVSELRWTVIVINRLDLYLQIRVGGLRLTVPVVLAFLAIYVLWGSTFLAIRVAVHEMPPLFAAGIRFATAGTILYLWQRARGQPNPNRLQWRNLWVLGVLMFLITYSGLFWAETRIPSGIASVLVASLPVWTLLLEALVFRISKLRLQLMLAILLGLVGVAVLMTAGQHGSQLNMLPCLAILVSEFGWALGSVTSRRMSLPASKPLSAGAQMMTGGVLLLVFSALAGELNPFPHPTRNGLAAIAYLIVAGSLLGYTAYVFLLGHMPATTVSSYAYVNPLVALGVGYWFGGESIGARTLVGTLLVLGSVLLILLGTPASTPGAQPLVGEMRDVVE